MAATRYWSVEECRWVDQPAAEQPEQVEGSARLDDELSTLPRQRGFDELRERSWDGVEA